MSGVKSAPKVVAFDSTRASACNGATDGGVFQPFVFREAGELVAGGDVDAPLADLRLRLALVRDREAIGRQDEAVIPRLRAAEVAAHRPPAAVTHRPAF